MTALDIATKTGIAYARAGIAESLDGLLALRKALDEIAPYAVDRRRIKQASNQLNDAIALVARLSGKGVAQ